ncbi:excinuclease ABC subunit UvrC [bacterium]|nr:excinuclease ABC subunit UvrC [bacterium]
MTTYGNPKPRSEEKITPPSSATLEQKLELLPREPGVYIFRDDKGKIIYIGKAKVLRSRVRSYFSGRDDGRYQFPLLVARIADLETIVTDNEVEALILESTLIRRHRPRFNIDVRNDTTYPYLKVTREPYPRVFLTRQPKSDGSKYYGPLTEVKQAKETVNVLRKVTHIRTCNLNITDESIREGKHKVCLEYHLGNCLGPCEGLQSEDEYKQGLQLMVDAVHGKAAPLIDTLEGRMKDYSSKLMFEEAAKTRDQMERTRSLVIRQKVSNLDELNRDIFGYSQEDRDAVIAVLRMRAGRIIGRTHSYLSRFENADRAEIWARYLAEFYVNDSRSVPDEIILPDEPGESDEWMPLLTYLDDKLGKKVKWITPQRGDKHRLQELATHNAELLLKERIQAKAARDRTPHSLISLAEHLKLENPPRVIECFDNSNLFGQHPVAAMVRFEDARPKKSEYRHYKIKTVIGIDDFGSMQEVVGRRYRRLLKENADMPDLILIDGGKGQVNAARRIADNLGLKQVPVIGLAKRLEEIVFPGSTDPITLPLTSSALKLLMQIRDETHRFAITYHRKLRGSAQISSTLESIDGIGESAAKALLKHFGSLKRLKEATPEQIAQVKGFSLTRAKKLVGQLGEL